MTFNLITDAWIPVIRQSGQEDTIAPWQIAERNNPVIEVRAPRPDLQGALYQFLIGLLQTCFAPEDELQWFDYWEEMPDADDLKFSFEQVQVAFELYNPDGAAFMQEHPDTKHPDAKKTFNHVGWCIIEDLVGGALSDNTRKENKDLFTKSGKIKVIDPYWAALALFNVQTSGVLAWGQHRTGLRGNAPLTTLLVIDERSVLLWQHLWLNIISKDQGAFIQGDWSKKEINDIFPWMGTTRISPKKNPTSPNDTNPLQHYWAMPRRIRLNFKSTPNNRCDLTGNPIEFGVGEYKRVTDGIFYTNGWVHPLTPYTRVEKNKFPHPIEGKNVGQGFRQWVSLNYDEYADTDEENKIVRWGRGLAVKDFYDNRRSNLTIKSKLWCFGYDADNAKVKCWYETKIPTFNLLADNVDALRDHITEALKIAQKVLEGFKLSLIRAWFKPQKDSKEKESWGYISKAIKKTGYLSTYRNIDYEYWEALESDFTVLVDSIIVYGNATGRPMECYLGWVKSIQHYCFSYFDQNALNEAIDSTDMKRVIHAKEHLREVLYPKKSSLLKNINEYSKQQEENR